MSQALSIVLVVLGAAAGLAVASVAVVGLVAAIGALRQPYCTHLSLRYMRSRRTNWIGVAGIFVAVGALILILSIMSGFLRESREHLRGNLADVIIAPRQDWAPLPPSDVEPLLAHLRADPRVVAAAAELNWVGMLVPELRGETTSNPKFGDLSLVNLVGVDVADEFATTSFRESLVEENRFGTPRVRDPDRPFAIPPEVERDRRARDLKPGAIGVVVGAQLAYSLRLEIGTEAELVTATVDPRTGRLVADATNRTVVVTGTFHTGENEMDLERVYFDRRTLAEDVLGREIPWTHVLVKLRDYERDKRAFVEDMRGELLELGYVHTARDPLTRRQLKHEIETWEDYRGSLLGAIENEKSLMGVMLSLVVLVAGFTVFALLSMMVSEKRRDIGILTALGGTPWRVMGLFVLIGGWQALFGATMGTLAGIWMAVRIDAIERALSKALGVQIFDRTVYLFDHIPSVVEPVGVGLIVLFSVICVLVFSAFPAWRAARLDPVQALRYE